MSPFSSPRCMPCDCKIYHKGVDIAYETKEEKLSQINDVALTYLHLIEHHLKFTSPRLQARLLLLWMLGTSDNCMLLCFKLDYERSNSVILS